MNLNEFEEKIKVHGQGVKNYITPPFDIEREELNMKKSSKFKISFSNNCMYARCYSFCGL